MLLCRNINICGYLHTFWKTWGKKFFLGGQPQCFLGKKCIITWFILDILLSWICKFAIMRKNDAFFASIVITRLTKIFMTIFAPDERLSSSATLPVPDFFFNTRPKPAQYWKNLPIGPSGCSKFIQRGHQIIKSAFRHKKGNWQKLLAASFIVGKTCRCVCAIFQAGRANFLLLYLRNMH